ncbi:MAG TPA: CcoQ/FixQ family Cbb3-type cytochrome c oxidase assembly chaperone [Parafilimonas sp.]|nr:CcoQ/FixQ family Cbb3-type cytochrome c oxidase assembly chaperone [Parafilimonas sp.]
MSFIHYLESITGVSIYALISFGIFFSFFIIMTIWACKADKKLIKTLSNIPLDNNQDTN